MKKQFKGAVFFDYDGTLTDKDNGIYTPALKTIQSINQLKNNGYAACLATGRSFKYIPKFDVDFDLLITANGGCTIYKNKIIGKKPFDKNILRSLTNFFNSQNMIYVIEGFDKCFVNLPKDKLFNKMINMFKVSPSLFENINDYNNEDICKILVIYRNFNDINYIKKFFDTKVTITVPNPDITSCDINPKYVSKANGIKDVCKYFNIDISNTYAFGDGENDYTMLKQACHGIAMLKHHPRLDEVSEFVTDSAAKNGIYEALLHYGLINKF